MIQESWDVLGCPGFLCSAACGALRIGGLVMCFLNPPKLAMDEASDGANQQASWPHGLMAHATRLGSSWFSGC